MDYPVFCQLWEQYIEVPLSQHEYVTSGFSDTERLFLVDSSRREVYDKYELIKKHFKQHYFFTGFELSNNSNPACTVDRHKRAALLCYAFNEVSPISLSNISSANQKIFRVFLSNQRFAFYLGLCSMLLDYRPEAFQTCDSAVPQDTEIFNFPDPFITEIKLKNGSSADNKYLSSIWRDLFFAHQFRNFNILTMANIYYLLEHDHCRLNREDLYPDLSQHYCE